MNILYLGDIMGAPGVRVVQALLPGIRQEYDVDMVIAQSENVTEGRGMSLEDYHLLRAAGVDACTGGNWTLYRDELIPLLNDVNEPVVRPANYPADTPGLGSKYVTIPKGKVLIVSLLGQIVGRDADKPVDNPLKVIDAILGQEQHVTKAAVVVNLHGDFSSEKIVIGHYLDGRVTTVVGDHWHVPTADARVLPKGTAHMTDVGMCGVLNASLGVKLDVIIARWRDQRILRNELETVGELQFSALLVRADRSGRAVSAEHVFRTMK